LDGIVVDGESRSVRLEMQNVSELSEDGKPSGAPKMVFPDGEVLTLVYKDNVVEIIVEWHDFSNHDSVVRSYRFLSDSIKPTLDFH
jgi:hypothetical protein